MMNRNRVLIHGIGNEILTDDGIGPKLVKRLQVNLFKKDIALKFIHGTKSVIAFG